MARYLSLVNFTEQGRKAITESPQRARRFTELAESLGARVESLYWALGSYDGAFVFDAPDEQTAAALILSLAQTGNVRTETLRIFEADEFSEIAYKIAEP